jgi:hypothetical protein
MKTIKPLSPQEVENSSGSFIPSIVIEAVNNLLKKKYRNGHMVILQRDLIKEIFTLDPTMTRDNLFDNNWLDFEPLFRKVGWEVEYDKPGYNETYEPNFSFRPKKK